MSLNTLYDLHTSLIHFVEFVCFLIDTRVYRVCVCVFFGCLLLRQLNNVIYDYECIVNAPIHILENVCTPVVISSLGIVCSHFFRACKTDTETPIRFIHLH